MVEVVVPVKIGAPVKPEPAPEPVTVAPVRDRIAWLVNTVGERTGVDARLIWSDSRMKKIAFARQVVMFLAYRSGLSSTQIGRRFNRDHTTVMHGIRKIERELAVLPTLAALIAQVEEAV